MDRGKVGHLFESPRAAACFSPREASWETQLHPVHTTCNRACLQPEMPPLKVGDGNHLGSAGAKMGVLALPVWVTLLPQCALQCSSVAVCRLGCKLLFLSLIHELGPKAAAGSKILFCGWHSPKGSKTILVNLTDTSGS